MELLDWQSDGVGAVFALVIYAVLLVALVARSTHTITSISRMLPAALLWHCGIFIFIAFWLLPHYAALGQADAIGYFADGMRTAENIRSGNWQEVSFSLGTDIIPLITALIFLPAGGNIYGIIFLSGALGLCGSLYFCQALALWASPEQVKSYARIILFLPSFVTWTSIFGKDSWICLGLGLAAYGYALMLKARTSSGLWYLLAGLAVTTLIRPHISLILAASMALAYLLGVTQKRRGSLITKAAMIVTFVAICGGLVTVASSFIGVSDFSVDSVEEYAVHRSQANAGAGNSDVEVQAAPGVAGTLRAFPRGIIRVMFQPFPWEVNGFNSALAAAENIFLLWYIVINARRLRQLIRGMSGEPYLLFSSAIMILLLLMLSLTPNLGLISRQRAQLLPFLFALLVAAKTVRKRPGYIPAPNPQLAARIPEHRVAHPVLR